MIEEKQKIIDSAMAKLTEEEKKALGLIKKPKKPKVKKSYKMIVYYMIGDANGNTTMSETISANNPFLPLVTSALDKLKIVKGRWGMVLDDEFYRSNFDDKNISESEHDLLCLISNYGFEDDEVEEYFKSNNFEVTEENYRFLSEFEGLLVEDTEYSFLVYEGYKLR